MTSNCTPLVLDAVERASKRAAATVHQEMSRGFYPLATIAASATLVGLLATVAQLITHTFYSFGASRSTILGSIAGRVSESLSFTALGLLVSIVAFAFYRHLNIRMETFDREMEHAAAELVSCLAVRFGPLRKTAPQARPLWHFLEAPVAGPRFLADRMFRHGVLEVIWPRLTSRFDADAVLQGGMWISFAYGLLGWLNSYWDRRSTAGTAIFIFFVVAGLGVRAGSLISVLSLFAFLEFAFAASLMPLGWMFTSTCLLVSPLLLVGSLKAARFSADTRQTNAKTLWNLRLISNLALTLSGLAGCTAVLFGTVLALYPMGDDSSMEPDLQRGDWVISINSPAMRKIRYGDILAFPYYWNTTGIERVAGMPGDSIRVESGKLIRNGKTIAEPYVMKPYTAELGNFPLPTEAFPDGFLRWQHANAYRTGLNKEEGFVVPKNSYFLLNDDRNELMDSRILGPFPKSKINGRALLVYHPWRLPRLLR